MLHRLRGLHAARPDYRWAHCPGCLRCSLDLALREGDSAGSSRRKEGRLGSGCMDRLRSSDRARRRGSNPDDRGHHRPASGCGPHSSDCDAWTDQCAEPIDDFGGLSLRSVVGTYSESRAELKYSLISKSSSRKSQRLARRIHRLRTFTISSVSARVGKSKPFGVQGETAEVHGELDRWVRPVPR